MKDIVGCSSFGEAMQRALGWLREQGVTSLDESYEANLGVFGRRCLGGHVGYRIEIDEVGPHINVWCGKTKPTPHFVFPGNAKDVLAMWRQLFFWDPSLVWQTPPGYRGRQLT